MQSQAASEFERSKRVGETALERDVRLLEAVENLGEENLLLFNQRALALHLERLKTKAATEFKVAETMFEREVRLVKELRNSGEENIAIHKQAAWDLYMRRQQERLSSAPAGASDPTA